MLKYLKDRDRYRVWHTDWYGDDFVVLTPDEFDIVSRVCRRLHIPILEHHDEEPEIPKDTPIFIGGLSITFRK